MDDIVIYLPKTIIYILWCYVAIKIRLVPQERIQRYAILYGLGFGVLRALLGLLIGFLAFKALNFIPHLAYQGISGMDIYTLGILLIILHFFNWMIMLKVMNRGVAWTKKAGLWLAGGVLVSCVGDLLTFNMVAPYMC